MKAEDLIRAIEDTGVRRSETDIIIDAMDRDGLSLVLKVEGVRVQRDKVAIIANPVRERCPNRHVDGPCTAPGCDGD